jgi:hypothetical protein
VPDQNDAGIRLDGSNLVLRNTGFYDNENGILGGEDRTSVTIEYSAFARNGFGDGFTHNLYIGFVDRLNVKASYFHHAKIGHNLKSRGKENYIENSYFLDGTTGYIYAPNNAQALTVTANLFAGRYSYRWGRAEQDRSGAGQQIYIPANVPDAATANFWPSSQILSQLGLSTVPNPQYVNDAPQPMVLRSLGSVTGRMAGALQAAP